MDTKTPGSSLSDLNVPKTQSFFDQFPAARLMMLVSVILLFISGSTFVASFIKFPDLPAAEKPSVTSTPHIPSITATPTLNPTANWKVYTNTKIGFTLKYPSVKKEATITQTGVVKPAIGTEDNTVIEFPGNNLTSPHDFVLEVFPYDGELKDLPNYSPALRKYSYGGSFASTKHNKDFRVGEYETEWYKKVSIEHEKPRFEIFMIVNGHALIFHSSQGTSEQDMEIYLQTLEIKKGIDSPPESLRVTPSQPPVGPVRTENTVLCAQDVKLCPDGTYVSRQGPSCEFTACPQ